MKKITRTTIKNFIKREIKNNNLYVKAKSDFDGIVDCVMPVKSDYMLATIPKVVTDYNLGVSGAWFVGSSRDYFTPFEDGNFIGYEVYNCCGSFLLAMEVNR